MPQETNTLPAGAVSVDTVTTPVGVTHRYLDGTGNIVAQTGTSNAAVSADPARIEVEVSK